MFTKITIQEDERGLLFRDGRYVKLLQPGTNRSLPFSSTGSDEVRGSVRAHGTSEYASELHFAEEHGVRIFR
ncbi:hypothetical protein YDYSY3_01630 [Paenibacillus chitinolyticus]|uniref:hypothetical protein n=1 Tax=Paenibacillus chitinolyticus TaxID=79263 RepID=UPI0026E4A63B|nr:hypothetical protein [Paenibacillus chitinolyticus]GKS09163.1 hypothetical protein YDYSY3_01630 [Paenibacillus chitinolyticus]